jgi:Domain of unknown function (DUF3883)
MLRARGNAALLSRGALYTPNMQRSRGGTPRGWAREEVEATVASYFAMLQAELSGMPYNKTEYRRQLLPLLNDRSEQSIEFKHANISAILIELGFPFISGYKPRSNYQELLLEVVSDRLKENSAIQKLVAADIERVATVPSVDDILSALTDPPKPVAFANRANSPVGRYVVTSINYLEREASNRSLGLAGEEFVINFERARLIHAGAEKLASKIEHVSKEKGDGAGFDVLSFEKSGEDRLIEVKTTKYGAHTPFYVSRNEVEVSKGASVRYHLYRLFEFRERPRLFTLRGALPETCTLDATNYVARVGGTSN